MDEIDKLAMMSDEELLKSDQDNSINDLATMSDEELLKQGMPDPSELPQPQTGQMRDFAGAKRVADNAFETMTFGLAQHPAGAMQGIATGVEQFKQSEGQPFLDRIGQAFSGFTEGYAVGRDDYNEYVADLEARSTPEERLAGGALGLAASLGGAKLVSKAAKEAVPIGQEIVRQTGIQSSLGFLGSRGETIDDMAIDGLAAAMIGGGLPVAIKGVEFSGQKVNDAANFMWDLAKKGATKTASVLQGLPTDTIAKYASMTDDDILRYYSRAGNAVKGQGEVIARNYTDGVRKAIENKRKILGQEMTKEIDTVFGNKPISDDHLKFIQNKLNEAKKGLNPTIASDKKVLDEISGFEAALAPKTTTIPSPEITVLDMLAGRKKAPPTVTSEPVTYQTAKKIYDDMKDLTKQSYIRDNSGNVVGVDKSSKVSRIFKDIIEDKKDEKGRVLSQGLKEGFVRKLSPRMKSLDGEYEKLHNIRQEASQSLLKKKGSTKSAWEKAGSGEGTPFTDLEAISKALPNANVRGKADEFAAMNQIGEAPWTPQNFGARVVGSTLIGGTVATAGAAGYDQLDSSVPAALGLLTLGTSPMFTKLVLDGMRRAGAVSNRMAASRGGQFARGAKDFLMEGSTSANALREYNKELRDRLGMDADQQGSPLQ
jgi:hypothetical protein